MQKNIETIARGVCVKDGKILLCQTKGADILYLPGGHVEFEETARCALEREITEELGLKSRAGDVLGMIEHSFLQRGERHCEWNVFFALEIEGLSSADEPDPAEDHLNFQWCDLAKLNEVPLEPAVLRELLAAPGGWGELLWVSSGDFEPA